MSGLLGAALLLAIHLDLSEPGLLPQLERVRIHSPLAPYGFSPSVEVSVTIDEHGKVVSAHAFSGPRQLFARSEAAEKLLVFKPFLRHGKPVRAVFTDTVDVLPPERFRTPRVPFPVVQNPNNVVFLMERRYASASDPRFLISVIQINPDRVIQVFRGPFPNPREFETPISSRNYAQLLNDFRAADFYSMEPQYDAHVTDAEGITISITIDGHTRTVETYAGRLVGVPDSFYRLAEKFDELAETEKHAAH